jgi:hypothetical protein
MSLLPMPPLPGLTLEEVHARIAEAVKSGVRVVPRRRALFEPARATFPAEPVEPIGLHVPPNRFA